MALRYEGGFQVDPGGLDDFGRKLRADVEASLDPGAARVSSTFSTGATFGRQHQSEDVYAARRAYYDRLMQSAQLMATYVEMGRVLADAVEDVARAYRDADQSAVSMTYMDEVFRRASRQVDIASAPVASGSSGGASDFSGSSDSSGSSGSSGSWGSSGSGASSGGGS